MSADPPTLPCRQPEFTATPSGWSACIRCGRLAWDHEQADPLADIRNTRTAPHAAPVMLTEAEWRARDGR